MKKQTGIALFQVLLIVAIISLLLLSMVRWTQSHLAQTRLIQEQVEADFELYTRISQGKFALLTEPWLTTADSAHEPLGEWSRAWNFYSRYFVLDESGARARIDNLASMPNLNQAGFELETLLVGLGYSAQQASLKRESLRHWQDVASEERDVSARLPIQSISELQVVPNWEQFDAERVRAYVTVHGEALFNPAYVADDLLPMFFSEAQSDMLRGLRDQERFNVDAFSRITGIQEDEFMSFFAGPAVRVSVEFTSETGRMHSLQQTLIIDPYGLTPISHRE